MKKALTKEKLRYWSLAARAITAIGVTGGLVFLAMQVGANTKALMADTHHHVLTLAQRPTEILLADPNLAAIVEAGERDPSGLSPAQWKQFRDFQIIAFNGLEYVYLSSKSGLVSKDLADAIISRQLDRIRTKPGLEKFWRENKSIWSNPFISYVDAQFSDDKETVQTPL